MFILTDDWLQNNKGWVSSWQPNMTAIKYKEYYGITCDNIRKVFYLRPTNAQIEEFIQTGKYTHTDTLGKTRTVTSRITSLDERVNVFKTAQANQLIYDEANGRGALVDGKNTISPDALSAIDALGLYQRTEFTR